MSKADIIDLTSPPAPLRSSMPKFPQPSTKSVAKRSVAKSSLHLPKGDTMAGKTVRFAGIWMSMSIEQAKELCKAHGGCVVEAGSPRIDYLVVGSRTPPDPELCTALAPNARVLTERHFLNLILPSDPVLDKENVPVATSKKRPLDSAEAGPSKPAKAARKPSPSAQPVIPKFNRVHTFIGDGNIELHGKTLKAFDCGGEVFRAQRGKIILDLLEKFEEFLESCDGEYHMFL